MPTIKPVSDLRNYNEVLTDVREGSPVFLTKNGRGCYAVLDIRDFDRISAASTLLGELDRGRTSAASDGWIPESDVLAHFDYKAAHAGC